MRIPPATRTTAASTWPASLKPTLNRLPSTSSRSPTTNTIVAAEQERHQLRLDAVGLLQHRHGRGEVRLRPTGAARGWAPRSSRPAPPG